MFKHGDHKHETVAQARHCEAGGKQVVAEAGKTPGPEKSWTEIQRTKLEDSRTLAPRNLATPKQMDFVKILVDERAWAGSDMSFTDSIMNVIDGKVITKTEASALITHLKGLPKVLDLNADLKGVKPQTWRLLAEDVPSGNYAIEVPGDKTHFFRVSRSSTGFFKLQERASESLFNIPLKRYAGILQQILDAGVEAAGLLYAQKLGRCYRCGLLLTDENNPYKARGLGPDCGPKTLG